MTKHQDVLRSLRYSKVSAVLMGATEPIGAARIQAMTNIDKPVVIGILESMYALKLVDRKLIKRNKQELYVYWLAKNQHYARKIVNKQTGWYNERIRA